jgi:AraC-like DNA-binding protein
MSDFLAEKLQEIDDRLKELQEETQRLQKARQALAGAGAGGGRRRGPGRPRGSRSSSSGNGRRRRRSRAGGTAAERALELVRQNPGITVSQAGDQLGYTQKNYLYRVFHNLTEDGSVKKEGKGYVAA